MEPKKITLREQREAERGFAERIANEVTPYLFHDSDRKA